jgi:hypothetical protein
MAGGITVTVEGWVGLPVELKDLSHGGFGIICGKPFSPGMTQDFMFATSQGFSFGIVAKAVHCAELPGARFISGWQFCKSEGDDILIAQLVDEAVKPE